MPRRAPPVSRSRRLALALVLGLAAACSGERDAEPPRLVVLYVPCTVAQRALSPYAAEVDWTPSLASFARESVVFRRHTTEAEQSGPAFASIVSGAQVDRHGVLVHPRELSQHLYLISEAFADAGYETWAWDGHPMASRELAYQQGVAEERSIEVRVKKRGRLTAAVADAFTGNDARFEALLERLRADPSARAFVQFTFTLSHGPYTYYAPRPAIRAFRDAHDRGADRLDDAELERWLDLYTNNVFDLTWDFEGTAARLGIEAADRPRLARAVSFAYGAAIERLDGLFGSFVDKVRAAGLLDESVIAFTADHGETGWRDNVLFPWTHGYQLAPESLDVPWILRAPSCGVAAGEFEGVTRSIDVFPTLAGLCGVRLPAGTQVEGVDLSAALRGRAPAPELEAWSHSTSLHPVQLASLAKLERVRTLFPNADPQWIWVCVRRGDRVAKLRHFGDAQWGVEVFDLATDPEERRNLFDPASPEHAALAASLADYKERLLAGARAASAEGAPTPDDAFERLKELGYAR